MSAFAGATWEVARGITLTINEDGTITTKLGFIRPNAVPPQFIFYLTKAMVSLGDMYTDITRRTDYTGLGRCKMDRITDVQIMCHPEYSEITPEKIEVIKNCFAGKNIIWMEQCPRNPNDATRQLFF